MAATEYIEVQGGRQARGCLRVPGDKSITHRALFAAHLLGGTGRLHNISLAQDCRSTMAALEQMGSRYRARGNTLWVQGPNPGWTRGQYAVDAGNSGTTARLLMGAAAFLRPPGSVVISGDASLSRRPMERVARYLRRLGIQVTYLGEPGYLPLRVEAADELRPRRQEIVEPSAQVKSAVLLAALAVPGEVEVVQWVSTRDHTEVMLTAMGADICRQGTQIRLKGGSQLAFPEDWRIPGDFSSAAWWLALAAVSGRVRLKGVGVNPTRLGFANILAAMGARVSIEETGVSMGEAVADIRGEEGELKGIAVPPEIIPTCIDELPLLAVVAAFARGETVVRGAGELRIKESDRLAELGRLLTAFGADFDLLPDGYVVRGGGRLKAAEFVSHDHRLVMAAAIMAVLVPGRSRIGAAGCVGVSYPGFWEDLEQVCLPQPQNLI